GVILSATDPVAVVALLKELGVKSSLSTSIEGESLFNDGTALVIFLIVVKIVEGDVSADFLDYLSSFLVMSVGGMVWGIVFGNIIIFWLGLIFNDALSEITITMASAYLCFYVAERILGVSGVIAVVAYGLYFGSSGKTRVSPEVAHFLEEFWELLAFFGNTLIFVVAGIVIMNRLESKIFMDPTNVGNLFLVWIMCNVIRGVVVTLAFYFMNLFLKGEDKLLAKDQVVGWWGGLRGAVGLALAMMIFDNDCIAPEIRDLSLFYMSGLVIFTVIFHSLTMPKLVSLVGLDRTQASRQMVFDQAMRSLREAGARQEALLRADHVFDAAIWEEVRKYYFEVPEAKITEENVQNAATTMAEQELQKISLEAKEARRRVLLICKKSYWKQFQDGLLSTHSVKYLMHHTDLCIDNDCQLVDWQTYQKLLTFNSSINTERKAEQGIEIDATASTKTKILKRLDSIPAICLVLVIVFVACTWSILLGDGESPPSYRAFEYLSTVFFCVELGVRLYCLGDYHSFLADPYTVMDAIVVFLDLLLLLTNDLLEGASGFTKGLRVVRFVRLVRLFRVARLAKKIQDTNVEATNDTKSLWDKSEGFAKSYKRRILYSQLQHGYDVASGFKIAREEALDLMSGLLGSATRFRHIRDGIEKDMKSVRSSLLDMQRLYSEIASSITTGIAARTVLNKQRHAIHELYHEGMLEKGETEKMLGSVEYQMKRLQYNPPVISMPAKEDLLRQIPWLECLDAKEMASVVDSFVDSTFTRGDVLMKQDDTDDTVYVLARGTVVVELETQLGEKLELDELGMGSVFGEIAWALRSARGASIIATSPGLLFNIAGSKLREIADNNRDLSDRLWDTCGRRLSENIFANQLEHQNKSRRQIRDIVHDMELFTVKPENKRVEFRSKAHVMLLTGVGIQNSREHGPLMSEGPEIIKPADSDLDFFTVDFTTGCKFMAEPYNVAIRKDAKKGQKGGALPGARNTRMIGVAGMESANHFGQKNQRQSTSKKLMSQAAGVDNIVGKRSKSGRLGRDSDGNVVGVPLDGGEPVMSNRSSSNDGDHQNQGMLVFQNGDIVAEGDMEDDDEIEDQKPAAGGMASGIAMGEIGPERGRRTSFGNQLHGKLEISKRYKEPSLTPTNKEERSIGRAMVRQMSMSEKGAGPKDET
ncbi:hypothetical protein TeGR_g7785, partial [Tetraparma gracilis]